MIPVIMGVGFHATWALTRRGCLAIYRLLPMTTIGAFSYREGSGMEE